MIQKKLKSTKIRQEKELVMSNPEKDGWKYEGEWLKGKAIREGYGICVNRGHYSEDPNVKDDVLYEGYFKNDKRHWKGREILHGVGIYEGEYEDNRKHGFGEYEYYNGDSYHGKFDNDLRHG